MNEEIKKEMNSMYGKLTCVNQQKHINLKNGKTIIINADEICLIGNEFVGLKLNDKLVCMLRFKLIDSII